jgi:hypothetical protein
MIMVKNLAYAGVAHKSPAGQVTPLMAFFHTEARL